MVAVPTPLDWVANAGSYATAALLKAGVQDPLKFLLDPPECRVRQTVVQSITSAGGYQALTFTTEDYDNEATAAHLSGTGMHDTVTNTNRIICRTPGRYMLIGGYTFAINSTGRRASCWHVNGAAINTGQQIFTPGSTTTFEHAARTMVTPLAVGDYVELRVYQDSGATLSTTIATNAGGYATVRWVGL